MSMASAMSGLRDAWGRVRAAGVFAVRYDALSDRYVCRSGRHDAAEECGLTCACGRRPVAAAALYGPVTIPRPRVPLP